MGFTVMTRVQLTGLIVFIQIAKFNTTQYYSKHMPSIIYLCFTVLRSIYLTSVFYKKGSKEEDSFVI